MAAGKPRAKAKAAGDAVGTIKVRAIAAGQYGDIFRRPGDVFRLVPRTGPFMEVELDKDGKEVFDRYGIRVTHEVEDKTLTAEDQFSPKWMEKVSDDTPERKSTSNEQIRQEHDQLLLDRMDRMAGNGGAPPADPPTGNADVL